MTRKFMSPLTLGFIVSGILFFAIVAVVRGAMGSTNNIDAATVNGVAALERIAPKVNSNIAEAMPTFAIAPSGEVIEPLIWWDESPEPEPLVTVWPTMPPLPVLTATPVVYVAPTLPAPTAQTVPVFGVVRQNGEILIMTSTGQYLRCSDIWFGYGGTAGINAGNPLEGWFNGLDRQTQLAYVNICDYQKGG